MVSVAVLMTRLRKVMSAEPLARANPLPSMLKISPEAPMVPLVIGKKSVKVEELNVVCPSGDKLSPKPESEATVEELSTTEVSPDTESARDGAGVRNSSNAVHTATAKYSDLRMVAP